MNAPLRNYQQALVKAAGACGNHIVVLPTGTGKTRIVVELTRQLLQSKPGSLIVFLTATVTLAQQQAGMNLTSCICSSCRSHTGCCSCTGCAHALYISRSVHSEGIDLASWAGLNRLTLHHHCHVLQGTLCSATGISTGSIPDCFARTILAVCSEHSCKSLQVFSRLASQQEVPSRNASLVRTLSQLRDGGQLLHTAAPLS